MIRFYDLDKGQVFDGSNPYVFQLGDGVSTGIWTSRTIVFLFDNSIAEKQGIDFDFPEDSKFYIFQMPTKLVPEDEVNINGHGYLDLQKMITHHHEGYGVKRLNTSHGIMKMYRLSVVFMSDSEGEFHDTLKVSHLGIELGSFEFAADVYGEDERLPIDAANLGVEIPKQFQKAVYDANVREETEDYVLLNRKWKELLIEYWNVIANKGNYRSLTNSLKFFEYGDLVKISEYWKYVDNFDTALLVGRDISQILDEEIHENLDVLTKTTYIGLSMLINGLTGGYESLSGTEITDSGNEFLPEPVPELEYISTKWTIEDITLKMTLLANYFSTYFMPIHLDLIHSSVDRLVFTNCIKILESVRRKRQDYWDDQGIISCNLSYETDYWLENTRTYNNPETALRNANVPEYWGDLKRVGVEEKRSSILVPDTDIDDTKIYLNQLFGGVGVKVPVEMSYNAPHSFFKRVEISVYKMTGDGNYSLTANYTSYDCSHFNSDKSGFMLVFTEDGKYNIQIQLVDSDDSTRSGSWYINIHGRVSNRISLKRLRKIDVDEREYELFDDWFYNNLDFNSFMFTEPFADQIKYKQWLMPTPGCDIDGIGMNKILVIDCGTGPDFRTVNLSCEGFGPFSEAFSIDVDDSYPILEDLRSAYPHYWWKVLIRPVALNSGGELELTEEYRYYIVGVRKYFDIEDGVYDPEDRSVTVYSGRYIEYSPEMQTEEPEDWDWYDIVVRKTISLSAQDRGYVIVTAPVGTTITINGMATITTDSENTTIPMVGESAEMELEFYKFGHFFRKTIHIDGMLGQVFGTPEYTVVSDRDRRYTTIQDSRFFPIFHRLEDVSHIVKMSDTVVCIPDLRWVGKGVTGTRWEFVNATTGEITQSKSFREYEDSGDPLYIEEPFIGRFDFRNSLTKGYYDIILHYDMGGVEQTETVESAFRIE